MGASLPPRGLFLAAMVPVLVLAGPGHTVDRTPVQRERCTSDIQLPFSIQVVPIETPHPGAALRVRVEVQAVRDFEDATLQVMAPSDVAVSVGRTADLGPLSPRAPRQHEFTLIVPPAGARRNVDVKVRALLEDGRVFEGGATLVLNFQAEASREVTEADGTKVREVLARRIQ
jgi:hypothetical protein